MPRPFPDGFRWGTATAAHQIEGGNWNNDWWDWEHTAGLRLRRAVAATPATRWHRWRRRRRPRAPTSASTTTASRSSGAASSPRRASGRRPRSTTTAAGARPCSTPASTRSSPSTTSRRPAGWPPRAAGPTRRPPTASPRSAGGSPASSAPVIASGLHDQRAQHRRRPWATWPACSRPASATSELRRRVNDVFVDAHRKAVDAIRKAAPGVPVGLTLSMSDYQAVDGGESQARAHPPPAWRTSSSRPPRATTSSACRPTPACRVGPDGVLGQRGGRRRPADGLRVLARVARRPRSAGRGRSPAARSRSLVTENGIGTDDDDAAHPLRAARRSRASSTASTTASTCAATRTGRCSTTSSGPSATGPASASSTSTAPPSSARRSRAPRWLGDIARANALPD